MKKYIPTILSTVIGILIGGCIMAAIFYSIPGYKYEKFTSKMRLQPTEDDHVTCDYVRDHVFTLVEQSALGPYRYWKLKCGSSVINLRYMPDTKYWKYDIGEEVPAEKIIQLMHLDAQINSGQWDLHKHLQ